MALPQLSTTVIVNASADFIFSSSTTNDTDDASRVANKGCGEYRLDRIANKVAHERTCTGLESCCESTWLQPRILRTNPAVGDPAISEDGTEGIIVESCETSKQVSVQAVGGTIELLPAAKNCANSSSLQFSILGRLDSS